MASKVLSSSGGFEYFQDESKDNITNVITIDPTLSRSASSVDETSPPQPTITKDVVEEPTTLELLKQHWLILGIYILAYSTMGLGLALIGPALNILGRQVGISSTSKLSTIFIARAAGFLVGSVVGGQVVDRYGKKFGQFFTCFCLLGSALSTAAYPWATSLIDLFIISFFAAVVMGALDNLLQVLLLALFKDKSPPFMQALHAGFALGAFLAPLFIAVFLDGEDEHGVALGPYEWGFYTMGIYMLLITVAATTITYYGIVPPESTDITESVAAEPAGVELDDLAAVELSEAPTPTASEISFGTPTHSMADTPTHSVADTPTHSTIGSPTHVALRQPRRGLCDRLRDIWATGAKNKNGFHGTGMVLVAAGSLLLWLYVGSETGYGNLISSYATKMGYMGDSDAALLASVFWGFFLVGRVVGVMLSLRYQPELLIMVDLVAAVVSVFLTTVSGSVTVLWVCSGALGMAVGSLYAAMVTWIDQVVEMSGQVLSILVVWVCLGEALFPLMMSLVMEVHPRSMLIFHVAVLFGCCVLFAFMRTYRKKHTD